MIETIVLASWVFLYALLSIILIKTLNDTSNLLNKKNKNVKQNTTNNNNNNRAVRTITSKPKERCGFTIKKIS